MSAEFIDTNLLLYAYGEPEDGRHERAVALVTELVEDQRAVISVQVMQEFYVAAVSKVAIRLTPDQAALRLEAMSRWFVYSPIASDVVDAAKLAARHQLSFWDAMIVLAASRMKCGTLWTEDLNAGQVVEGVTIRSPFV